MKQEIAVEWVKNLRLGKFKQTTAGALRDREGFCCLGVLCDIFGKSTADGIWRGDEDREKYDFVCTKPPDFPDESLARLRSNVDLPGLVQEWAGLNSSSGCHIAIRSRIVIGENTYGSLAEANDSGVPFNEIATFIEKNWKNL